MSVSDSHDAGSPDGPTESPIGNGRTVVYADELSEDGVRRAVQAGHAYVKNFADSPDLRLTASNGGRVAIMGDALPGRNAAFTATVTGATGDGWTLSIVRDGETIDTVPITGSRFVRRFEAGRPGEFRLQVEREGVVHNVSNPIAVGDAARPIPRGIRSNGRAAALRLRVLRVKRRGTRVQVTLLARSNGGAPLGGVRVNSGRVRGYTDSRGRVTLTLKNVFEPGTYLARATGRAWRAARVKFRVR